MNTTLKNAAKVTEEFDTADLKEAKLPLHELSLSVGL